MIKIKDLEVGKIYTIALVVTAAVARETKTKKPYLQLELFDGTKNISSNYWDWAGKNIPEKNTILDVTAQVTEWQGTLQLNIKGMATNTELHLSEFTPSSGADISTTYKTAYSMASSLSDDFLRELTLGILEELQNRWLSAPGAVTIHHAYTAGTLVHCLSVATIAKAIAEVTPGANVDMATAAGLLHDLGKLFGYRINGVICELTDEGRLYEHSFMGAEFVGNYAEKHIVREEVTYEQTQAKLEVLRHIILSHHGKLEHGSCIPPACIEAHIVHHADAVDAITEQIRDASNKAGHVKFTDRIWALDNRPHLTVEYISSIMDS